MDKIKVPFLDSYLVYTLIVFAYTICIYNVLSLLMFICTGETFISLQEYISNV